MYKFVIESKLGDYIKDEDEIVYKITGISVNIVFNEGLKKEEMRLLYEAVDARDQFGQFYIINEHLVTKATDEEVDYYILGPQIDDENAYLLSGEESGFNESQEVDIRQKEVESPITEYNSNHEFIKEEPKRTVDEVLDETLDTKRLIEMFGDKDGKYEGRLAELVKEFNEL